MFSSYDQKFLDYSILETFNKLDQKGKIMAEYVWIGAVDSMGDVRYVLLCGAAF